MATVAELSDKSEFAIREVSEQTGVPAVTLRAWERRYRLFSPQRTRGNYRLYSARDVAELRWLKGRVDAGVPISRAAAELQALRNAGGPPVPGAARPAAAGGPTPGRPPAEYAARLFRALTAHDEAAAARVLAGASAHLDLGAMCSGVLTPCLVEIGEGWARGEIRIATEHFASTHVRGWLLAWFQTARPARGAPSIIVGCAPDEHHDIGSLMVALLLRQAGYAVEFLGADVPITDLLEYVRVERPQLLCLSAGTEEGARLLGRVPPGLARLRPRPKFGFGGRVFNRRPELRALLDGVFLGEDAAQAVTAVRATIGEAGARPSSRAAQASTG